MADALPTKWSHVNHGSGVDQGKSASYRPTFLPLSHAANIDLLLLLATELSGILHVNQFAIVAG